MGELISIVLGVLFAALGLSFGATQRKRRKEAEARSAGLAKAAEARAARESGAVKEVVDVKQKVASIKTDRSKEKRRPGVSAGASGGDSGAGDVAAKLDRLRK